jgi:thiamine biosynthesis lipoprotein
MGTLYSVAYWSRPATDPHHVQREVNGILDTFEDELSNWKTGSWVNRFNAAPSGQALVAPEDAFLVLGLCVELAEQSGGRFDPTSGPLVELWGFGTNRIKTVPSEAAIQEVIHVVGYTNLVLDAEQQTVTKLVEGVEINCSAVAKGYAVDLVAAHLVEGGIENFLVNIGGEVAARGHHPDGDPWTVGVTQPTPAGRAGGLDRVVTLTNQCLATSGHSQRAFVKEGKCYTHVLDATTGRPVAADMASVTVLAPSCAVADGLATVALILKEEEVADLFQSAHPDVELFRTPWHEVHGTTKPQPGGAAVDRNCTNSLELDPGSANAQLEPWSR